MPITTKAANSTDCESAPALTSLDFNQIEANLLTTGLACCSTSSVASPGTGMVIDINPFTALNSYNSTVVTPSQTVTSWICSDSVEMFPITAANATNDRIDLIVVCTDGSTNPNATATNLSTISIITGIAAENPTPPTVPANCTAIGQILVEAGSTSINSANITSDGYCVQVKDCALDSKIVKCDETNRFYYDNTGGANNPAVCRECSQPFGLGTFVQYKQNGDNTGVVNLDFCGNVGEIKKAGGQESLEASDLEDCQMVSVLWNGTDWVLQNPTANLVNNDPYSASWDGCTGQAPSKDAIYDFVNDKGFISCTTLTSPGPSSIPIPVDACRVEICYSQKPSDSSGILRGRGHLTLFEVGFTTCRVEEFGNSQSQWLIFTWTGSTLLINSTAGSSILDPAWTVQACFYSK